MSDPKNNIDDNFIELDDLVDDGEDNSLDEIFDSHEDIQDDLDDLDGLEMSVPMTVTPSNQNEKLWVLLTIASLTLALLSSLLLNPMIGEQTQRANQAKGVLSLVDLTNISASQALTVDGNFAPVEVSLAEAESGVNSMTAPPTNMAKLSGAIFSNANSNREISQLWENYKASSELFMSNKAQVGEMKAALEQLIVSIGKSQSDSIGFVDAVAKEGRNKNSGSAKDKYLFLTSEASNLNGILGRLASTARDYYAPNADLNRVVDRQNGLIVRLRDTLSRIVSNSAAVVGTAAEPLQADYQDLEAQIAQISERVKAVADSRAASLKMVSDSVALNASLTAASTPSASVNVFAFIGNFLPIIFALIGGYALWRYFTLQSKDLVAQEANLSETLAEQQESILKLLDEMSALADGDLTVEAEVTDQITGAIADSVNFAVIEMRELVSQINRASIEVANESELAVNNAQSVSQSNMNQATEITSAATLMEQVSQSMHQMSGQASSSAEMAQESLQAAEQGRIAVRDTIKGMEDMREQIQDTSKRIKRLGESSQRIGDIVALIDDIAEQTNILSLNAAIQASMAGEAGRGFAVVSDEVQGLAERSTEATRKIAELVATIQTDTNDAVLSMEKATQQVVSGTQVADSAGNALAAIEGVSVRLSALIQGISDGSTEQAELVTQVSEQVSKVSASSSETSRKAQASANSIAKLLELAKDLETSVSRFKLPAA